MSRELGPPPFVRPAPAKPDVSPRPRPGPRLNRALGIVLFSVFAYCATSNGIQSYVQAHHLSDRATQLQSQLDHGRQMNDQRKAEAKALLTSQGKQTAARLYGYVEKGEVSIGGCPPPGGPLATMTDAEILTVPSVRRPSLMQRLRDAVEW